MAHGPIVNSPHSASIHILDDDSLLHVFYLYRPFILGEDNDAEALLLGGGRWVCGHWWYKLAHVCQRWRNIILGSSFYLDIFLVCTKDTPVADMLAHSPPLPLVIDYIGDITPPITAEDEEGIILALKQRDRVRRVRLQIPSISLQKLIGTINEEYPILEYLIVNCEDPMSILIFPETFQAPHLRHLAVGGLTLPIDSRLLTAAAGLVTLLLIITRRSTYFNPNTLLHLLSHMPQLETLVIVFLCPIPNRYMERHLMRTLSMAPVALPNLHRFIFRGVSTYLEELVHQIIAPRLEKLQIDFFYSQFGHTIPRLQHFINTTESLRFDTAKCKFSTRRVELEASLLGEEAEMHVLSIAVRCMNLGSQVSFMAQISNFLNQTFSVVEHLTLEHEVYSLSPDGHDEVDRNEWRKLLSSFSNLKTLCIAHGLVEGLSRCLQLDDGELSLELLPELQELTYSGSGNTNDAFTSFIDVRRNVGRPITLVRRGPSPVPT